jgi:hypothetical protein
VSIRTVKKDDRWVVYWYHPSYDDIVQAQQWLHDQWGNDWGQLSILHLNNDRMRTVTLKFYRLDHANWFSLKWA